MRKADTYRGHKRNTLRDQQSLRGWRFVKCWQKSNIEAKIHHRAEVCRQARESAASAIVAAQAVGQNPTKFVLLALEKFWKAQPNSRVRSRILRELAA